MKDYKYFSSSENYLYEKSILIAAVNYYCNFNAGSKKYT